VQTSRTKQRQQLSLFALMTTSPDAPLEPPAATALHLVTNDDAAPNRRKHDDVLATLRHELRTPLSGIIGLVGVLLDTPLTEQQRTMVTTLLAAGEHLGALLDQTLPGIVADTAPTSSVFDLHALVNDVVELFTPMANAKDVRLETIIAPGVETLVWGDATRLRQALVNLTSNAVKFTSAGRVVLAVHALNDDVGFAVIDSGPGFPVSNRTDLAPRPDGSGIGLVISRRVITALGGTLAIASVPDHGTTCRFTLSLPSAAVGHDRTQTGSMRRLLIGEDDAVSRQVLVHLAERLGYIVLAVESGAEVLRWHRAERWDAILLDRHLLDMDGLDVARTIREREAGLARRTPIIAATATGTDTDRVRCLQAGMDHYLSKPVSLDALAHRLDQVCTQPLTSLA
jgi:CheY-like chemotaxis protein